MTLQREVKRNQWIDYLVNSKPVKSPVDIDALPAGRYRLPKLNSSTRIRCVWDNQISTHQASSGHFSHEPGITRELVAVMDRIMQSGTPKRNNY